MASSLGMEVVIFAAGAVVGLLAYATFPAVASVMDAIIVKPAQSVGLAKNA